MLETAIPPEYLVYLGSIKYEGQDQRLFLLDQRKCAKKFENE